MVQSWSCIILWFWFVFFPRSLSCYVQNNRVCLMSSFFFFSFFLFSFFLPPYSFHCVTLCLAMSHTDQDLRVKLFSSSAFLQDSLLQYFSVQILIDFHNTLLRLGITINQGNGAQGDWGQKYYSVWMPGLRHLWPVFFWVGFFLFSMHIKLVNSLNCNCK